MYVDSLINQELLNIICNNRWLQKECKIELQNFYNKKLKNTDYTTKLNPEEFKEKMKIEYLKFIRNIKIKEINKNV